MSRRSFQSEIVHTLWGRRPHWRSRALVLAFLSDPHRNDPVCAQAYRAIMEFLRFLRMPGNGREKCLWAATHCTVEQALLTKIKDAFRFFGLSLSHDLVLSFGVNLSCLLGISTRRISSCCCIGYRDTVVTLRQQISTARTSACLPASLILTSRVGFVTSPPSSMSPKP